MRKKFLSVSCEKLFFCRPTGRFALSLPPFPLSLVSAASQQQGAAFSLSPTARLTAARLGRGGHVDGGGVVGRGAKRARRPGGAGAAAAQ